MPKLLYIALSCGLWMNVCTLPAQYFPQLTQQTFYDHNGGADHPRSILKDPEGNLLIGGYSLQAEESIIWIIRVDTLGNLLWKRELPLGGYAQLNDMALTSDGHVVFVGVSASHETGFEAGSTRYWGDYAIGKLSLAGEIQWLNFYGGSHLDQATAVVCRDNAIYVSGATHSTDGDVEPALGMGDAWTLYLDNQGDWQGGDRIGGRETDWATSLSLCQNGDILMAGVSFSPEINGRNPGRYGSGLLARLDAQGQRKWVKSFTSPEGAYFTDIVEAPTGNIGLVGRSFTANGESNFWWLLMDAWGEKVREYEFGENRTEVLTALELCGQEGWIMGGYATGKSHQGRYTLGRDDFWVVRLNPRGRVIWQRTFGGADHERCQDVLMYRPGVYYAIGEKWNYFDESRPPGWDCWLIRIEDRSCEELNPEIFVRAGKNKVKAQTPVRFRARHQLGERFVWHFGDGTQSEEEHPLKYYAEPGKYEVRLTVFNNESCRQSVRLEKELEVK